MQQCAVQLVVIGESSGGRVKEEAVQFWEKIKKPFGDKASTTYQRRLDDMQRPTNLEVSLADQSESWLLDRVRVEAWMVLVTATD